MIRSIATKAICTLTLVLTCGCAVATDVAPKAGDRAANTAGPLLDQTATIGEIPGLGNTVAGFYRDHLISFWEVWHRDVRTAECMSAAGLEYEPEALYPESMIVELAESLGVTPVEFDSSNGAPADPAERNAAIRRTLSSDELNTYYRVLNGESAADMAYMEQTELVPAGRSAESFATGGCIAAAEEPRVWDLRDRLMPSLDELREESRATVEFKTKLGEFTACWDRFGFPEVTSPRQVDELYLLNEDGPEDHMQSACDVYWAAAEKAGMAAVEPLFIAEHQVELEDQVAKYADVRDRITSDSAFLAFLSVRAGESSWIIDQD